MAILIVGLLLTAAATENTKRNIEIQSNQEFALVCNEIKTRITTRLYGHAEVLRIGSSLFAAKDSVTRNEWKAFIEHSKLNRNLPGIQGVGFSCIIQKNQLQHHVQIIRNEGFPDYTIRPAGDRDIYTSIIYLEPFTGRNLRAFGYDMYSEPVRRKAMEKARDFDLATISGKVILVQETNKDLQSGTLMYVPVYRNGLPANTIEERRAAIIGWVYSPYRMYDLMQGVLGSRDSINNNRIHLLIYDDDSISSNSLLFDSQKQDTIINHDLPTRTLTTPIEFNEKKWTLRFKQPKENYSYFQSREFIVLIGGIVISLLVFSLSLALFSIRRRAQQIAGQLTSELKESEERFRAITKSAKDAIITINIKGIVVDWNKGAGVTFGYTEEEITGKELTLIIPQQYSEMHTKNLERVVNGGNHHVIGKTVELWGLHKNGSEFPLELSLAEWESGSEKYFTGIIRDVTERKRTEAELFKAKEKAEESDRLKSAFLANMSHEIRTPMNGILGFAQLLKEPRLSDEEQQEYVKIIEKSGNRMLNIINDIVDIAKIESGQMTVSMSETNINQQIQFVYTFFKPEVEKRGMQLLIKNILPSKSAIVKSDREKIYAVLTNLVGNAVKYTHAGSIEMGVEKKGDNLEFFVKDTGIGVPEQKKGLIFERFRQGNDLTSQFTEGTGLELSISKAYVELLGGNIWVESEEGQGSTFYFTIPYNAEAKTEIVDKEVSSVIGAEVKNLKILIAEDDEVSVLLLSAALRMHCREIVTVGNGIEAVEAGRTNPDIDLFLMDLKMPEMDGFEAARQIRQFNKDVIIIAQTAFGLTGDREKAIEAGCNDFIAKPIVVEELKGIIREYFN